jgi:Domain of unknown function (DUF1707)
MSEKASRASIRASDADRDSVADRLRHAATEGRLATEEFEQRLESVFSARTYGQLETVLSDLPGPRLIAKRPRRRARRSFLRWIPTVLGIAVAVPLALALVALVLQLALGGAVIWGLLIAARWYFFRRHRRGRGPWGGLPSRRGRSGRHSVGYDRRSWTH